MYLCCIFFFFFSSRRRHTRCSRDWSSDVCSSDLVPAPRIDAAERVVDDAPSIVRRHEEPLIVVHHRGNDRNARVGQIGRASCRERGVDLGGRRISKKKKKNNSKEIVRRTRATE